MPPLLTELGQSFILTGDIFKARSFSLGYDDFVFQRCVHTECETKLTLVEQLTLGVFLHSVFIHLKQSVVVTVQTLAEASEEHMLQLCVW